VEIPVIPKWMTEADKHMSALTDKQAVPREQFRELIAGRGEMEVGAIEQKRYEECSLLPGPTNDVIVAAVIVSWSGTLISVLNEFGRDDWMHQLRQKAMIKSFRVRTV
jgi:hypothetical protein